MHTLLERISGHLVTALVVVSVFEAGLIIKIRSDSSLYRSHSHIAMPANSLQAHLGQETGYAACALLRVSSDACPFCRQDKVFYAELAKRAESAGCRSVIIGPKVGQVNQTGLAPGTSLLEYVDMAFGQSLYPFSTPQTILLDGAGNVLWFREGALDNHSLAEGLNAIERAH